MFETRQDVWALRHSCRPQLTHRLIPDGHLHLLMIGKSTKADTWPWLHPACKQLLVRPPTSQRKPARKHRGKNAVLKNYVMVERGESVETRNP